MRQGDVLSTMFRPHPRQDRRGLRPHVRIGDCAPLRRCARREVCDPTGWFLGAAMSIKFVATELYLSLGADPRPRRNEPGHSYQESAFLDPRNEPADGIPP